MLRRFTPHPGFLSLASLALLAMGAFAAFVMLRYDMAEQRKLAAVSTVWGMHACLLVAITSLVLLGRSLYAHLGRRRCAIAGGVFLFGYAVCGLAPETNRIYFDEHIYMQIGQVIAHTGRAEGANYARAEFGHFEVYDAWVNKQPNGYPYVLSWFYRIFGVSEKISHVANRICVGATALALYLALALVPWTLPRGAAGAAALLFCVTPLVPWWGNTAAVEPSTAATSAFAFLAACIFVRFRDPGAPNHVLSAALLAASLAFACYFRPESMLVYGVAFVLIWAAGTTSLRELTTWGAFGLAGALTVPQLLHIWSMRSEDWGATDGRRFDFAFIGANFRSNAGYFIDQKWFPICGLILAVAGLEWLKRKEPKAAATVLAWFLPAWGIFILFYAGGYFYGASSRYAIVSCAPVAVAMGIGAAALWQGLARWRLLSVGLFTIMGMNWGAAMHFVPTISRESAEARADIDFIAKTAPTLPDGSIVLSNDPCVWTVYHRNSAQVFNLEGMVRENMNELRRQYPGGVYLHWNFWHNVEKSLEPIARSLVQDTEATVFARYNSEDHQFALLRLDTPAAIRKFGGPPPPARNIPNLDDALAGIPGGGGSAP